MAPNLQFSVPESAYSETLFRSKSLKLSANRLAKAVFVRWLKSHHTVSAEEEAELKQALEPPALPDGF